MKMNFTISCFLMLVIGLIIFTTVVGIAAAGTTDEERVIRKLFICSKTQASAPEEYESSLVMADAMRKLGLDVDVWALAEERTSIIWYSRDRWDMTAWDMSARPERLDPDEMIYNLFHSSTVEGGYNFVGYINPEYDQIAEKQRVTIDKEERKKLINKAQEIIARDAVYIFTVNAKQSNVYNNQVFKPESIKDMAGIGIANFWTYIYAEPAGQQKSLIANVNQSLLGINPLRSPSTQDNWITEIIWDRLMRMDIDGIPKPWAAKNVEWITDTQVKITLRENMKWHDGEPVTIEDVKFTFEACMTGSPQYKPFVENIESMEIVDDSTLIFNLKVPSAAFEAATLAKIGLMPKHIWEPLFEKFKTSKDISATAEQYQEEIPIGSGPYKVSSLDFSEGVILEANKEYFAAPKMDRWIVRVIPNVEATIGMLKTGEINFLLDYRGDQELLKQQADTDPKLTDVSSISISFVYFAPNLRRAPFDDVVFRKAITAVTDRDFFVKVIYKGFAVPADSVISPVMKYWKNNNLEILSGGVEEGKKILKEAGYEWDEKGRLMYPKGKKEELKPAF